MVSALSWGGGEVHLTPAVYLHSLMATGLKHDKSSFKVSYFDFAFQFLSHVICRHHRHHLLINDELLTFVTMQLKPLIVSSQTLLLPVSILMNSLEHVYFVGWRKDCHVFASTVCDVV